MKLRTLLLAAVLWGGPALAFAQTSEGVRQAYASAAEALLPAYADVDEPTPLARRLRLELATGRYAEAEATAERLAELQRPTQPGRANALTPWRIYARARRYETEGTAPETALERAFGELYGVLSDREMAAVVPVYGADLDRLRDSDQQAAAACAGVVLTECPTAFEAVSARQALETWSYLLPTSERLIRADAERRFVIDDQALVPTADGVQIAAMVIRPRTAEPVTALLNFTIYNRDDWTFADAVQMAAHGYAGAVAYSRGTNRGTGERAPYRHDGPDAAAVIEWLAAQSWSDGRVGMFSGSYNSFVQWAALKQRPAALKAIATNASNAPGIDTPMQGGVFQTFIYPWPIYVSSGTELDEKTYGDRDRWERMMREWYLSGRSYRDLERIDGRANPIFASWLDHPGYDAFWSELIPQGQAFADIDIPIYAQTGYFDGGMVGVVHYLREHLRQNPDADHRVIIGPYHHTAQQGGVLPTINGYAVDRSAMIDLAEIRMQWFDHVFRGTPMPDVLRDRVNFQVMGADRWRHAPSLEAMADERMRLYLGGAEAGGRHRFTAAAPDGGQGVELRINLADRSDIDFEPPAGELDVRGGLLFATEPLDRALEIDGSFLGRFEIVTNKRDLDLEVVFFEQKADGTYLRLASYLGRVSYMADPSRRTLLEPGAPRRLSFESQTVTAARLAPGSRILALVAVPKRPDIQINYGTGGDVSDETIADAGEPLAVRFLPGSHLELGVRRDGE